MQIEALAIEHLSFTADAKLVENMILNDNLVGLLILLENGLDPNMLIHHQSFDKDRIDTPLIHVALHHKKIDIIKALLKYKANPNIQCRVGGGYTPIMQLISHRIASNYTFDEKRDMIDLLMAHGANVNKKSKNTNSPLHIANDVRIIELLMERGADIELKDDRGNTVLNHYLITQGKLDICEFLIRTGANLHTPNKNGVTPIDRLSRSTWASFRKRLGMP